MALGEGARRVFLVAGEPSGDVIGGRLMAALKRLSAPPIEFGGVGGYCMEREGLKSAFQMEDIAVMGIGELIPHLLTFSSRLKKTINANLEFKPNIIVTIDSKGFSFRFLKRLREIYARCGEPCPPCVHYVAPSFWAWKGGEAKLRNLPNIVDHLLCILPFEEGPCKENGLKATFVGHPVLEDFFELGADSSTRRQWQINGSRDQFREQHGLLKDTPLLSVLPGSREQELRRMLPVFGTALSHLSKSYPGLVAAVPTVPSDRLNRLVESSIRSWDVPVIFLPGASLETKYSAFVASNAGLSTSGTAVMQLQLARLPAVVAYRATLLTEWIIKKRTKLRYISLPNILLDSPAIPEALFSSCKAEKLASMVGDILESSSAREQQANAATAVLRMVQPSHSEDGFERPSSLAARVVLDELEKAT